MGEHRRKLEVVRGEFRKARILCLMPCYEMVYRRWFEHLLTLPRWERINYGIVSGATLPDSHNRVVKEALQRDDWDYILWLEQDVLPPRDVFERVELYQQEIVGALMVRRAFPPQPLVFHDFYEAGGGCPPYEWSELRPWINQPGIYPVDIVHMGCTAIRRDVFEKIGEQWYATPNNSDSSVMTDDIYFCRNARKHGFKVYLDTAMQCAHVGPVEWTVEMGMHWYASMKEAEAMDA